MPLSTHSETPALSQKLQQGLALQRRGELQTAESVYREILAIAPRHFDALQLLGVIAGRNKDFEQAAALFAEAIAVNADHAGVHCNLGLALQELGRREAALASYSRAVSLEPDFATAHARRGNVQRELGQLDAALGSLDRALAINPQFAEAYAYRGHVLRELRRLDAALESYGKAIDAKHDFAEAHYNRGVLLAETGMLEAGLASHEQAVRITPAYAEAHSGRAVVLQRLGRLDEALASVERAITLKPALATAYLTRGNILYELKRFEASLASIEQAIARKPHYAEAYISRGNVLRQLNEFESALASHEAAIAASPSDPTAHVNRGNVLMDLGRSSDALASYDRAIALHGDNADAHFCRAIALLKSGNFTQGWREYEWRWRSATIRGNLGKPRVFARPRWHGTEPLAGRAILLHSEQGLGDAIQFSRYAPMVAQLGATVFLEAPQTATSLLATLPGITRVLPRGEPLPEHDYQCPLMSLPLAFETTLATIPAAIPYLHAAPQRMAFWGGRLGNRSRPRIGLAWSGSPGNANDRNRSLPLTRLLAWLPAGFQYVSLHKELGNPDRETLAANPLIEDYGAEQHDLGDAAAICACMDIVISVDTSLAHLGGALGRNTWLLLPFNADWRWFADREDSPWYSTLRIFRQARIGDWDGVLRRVQAELLAFAARNRDGEF